MQPVEAFAGSDKFLADRDWQAEWRYFVRFAFEKWFAAGLLAADPPFEIGASKAGFVSFEAESTKSFVKGISWCKSPQLTGI